MQLEISLRSEIQPIQDALKPPCKRIIENKEISSSDSELAKVYGQESLTKTASPSPEYHSSGELLLLYIACIFKYLNVLKPGY